ncbi:MAG: insulinase family protein [Flavobacteriales bacterium]|nr:insulinase family protein [Flavobacteriales bacterium]
MNRSALPLPVQAIAAGLLVSLLAPASMNAQLDRSRPPAPGPAPVVQLGDHTTTELPNGMRLIVVEDHKLPLVSVQLRFDVPPIVQGDKAGFVDLVGELLTAGTPTRTKVRIDEDVDALGAGLFASNDGVYASVLKKNLGPLMDILEDVVQNPSFPEEELVKAKLRARSSVQQRMEDPEAISEAAGRAVTFGRAHPYGEVVTERTISNITRASIWAYHRYFFRPENAYLVFVGDVTEKEARDLAKAHFAKWKPDHSLVSTDEHGRTLVEGMGLLVELDRPAVPPTERRVFVVDRPDAAQSVIRVSFPLNLQPKDIRSMQAQVMNTLLGGGVFNARLMQNLREKRGFTYGCYSSLEVDRHNSSFVVTTSVRTAVTDSAVNEILNEMARMRYEPVTPEELELAKQYMMGSFGRSLEDPRTVARFALNTHLNELPADHYRNYLTRLEAVTAQQVMDAANAFLHPDQANILVVGDLERIEDERALLSSLSEAGIVQLDENGAPWTEVLTPVKDLTPERILDAYIKAVGGNEKLAALRHLFIERTAVRGADTLMTKEWYAPDQLRTRFTMNGAVEEEVIHDGKRVLFSNSEVNGELTDAGYDDVLLRTPPVPEARYGKVMERMILLGSTELGGRTVYKIMFQTMSGLSFAEYFDAETGLKVRRTDDLLYNGRNYHQVIGYSDWKPIGGVLFPHETRERGGLSGRLVRKISSSEANKPMPLTHFEVHIPEPPPLLITPDMLPPDSSVPVDE